MRGNGRKVWLNKKWVDWDDAKVSLHAHTLHYGLGVFEGIRYYKTDGGKVAIFRLGHHLKRLYDSAHIVGISIPYPIEEITEATKELVRINGIDEGYIRHIVFLDEGSMGINAIDNPISVAMSTWEWGAYLGDQGVAEGVRLKTSSYCRRHVNTTMTKAKVCGQYANSILARWEAVKTGYDEALLLDQEGFAAEATGENIFITKDGIIKTPPLMGVLPGITRDSVIAIAKEAGFIINEERLTRDEFYIADEVFLCGTAAEITPVREIDGRTIGKDTPGRITKFLQNRFQDIIRGRADRYFDWLMLI